VPTIKASKPSDFTAKQREEAKEAANQEAVARQEQLTMMNKVEDESKKDDVFDPQSGASLGKVETVKIDAKKKEVTIQVVEDVEDMTYGAGTHYTFKVGQKYKVQENIAQHLDELGLVWGGLEK
jgi:sporulation protein YlmC with PRC-barrel domain